MRTDPHQNCVIYSGICIDLNCTGPDTSVMMFGFMIQINSTILVRVLKEYGQETKKYNGRLVRCGPALVLVAWYWGEAPVSQLMAKPAKCSGNLQFTNICESKSLICALTASVPMLLRVPHDDEISPELSSELCGHENHWPGGGGLDTLESWMDVIDRFVKIKLYNQTFVSASDVLLQERRASLSYSLNRDRLDLIHVNH